MIKVSVKDYSYEWMLNRLYSSVSGKAAVKAITRKEVPKAMVLITGNYTIIRNFREITDVLRRDIKHLMRYLLKELGSPGNYDESSGSLILHGRFSSQAINILLNRYIKMYVVCPTCGSWDTVLKRKGKIWILICEACGAETSVKPV